MNNYSIHRRIKLYLRYLECKSGGNFIDPIESNSYRRVNLRQNPEQIDTKGFYMDTGSFDHA